MSLVELPQYSGNGLTISVIYDDADLSIQQLAWDNRSDWIAHVEVMDWSALLLQLDVYPGMVGSMVFPAGYSVSETELGYELTPLGITIGTRRQGELCHS